MSEQIEIWKEIPGYPKYEVSNLGSIRRKVSEKNIKPYPGLRGYLTVLLYNSKKKKRFYSHRLVAIAFLENPLNLPQVNHKDGNKHNNKVSNLEWVTPGGNNLHAYRVLGCKCRHLGRFSEEQVKEMIYQKNLGFSYRQISKMFNVSVSHAHGIVKGRAYKRFMDKC